MRLALLVCLCGVFAWYAGVHFVAKKPRPVALVVLASLVVPLGFFEAQWLHRERTYTTVTRDLTGIDDVKVHCQRTLGYLVDVSGYMGYVPYPPGEEPKDAYLRNDTCKALATYASNRSDPTVEQVRAVHVLTHEAMHLAGERNESHAECQAMQRNHVTAKALGATEEQAVRLAHTYWDYWYPQVPQQYRNAECRPGGSLDERLANPPWSASP